MNSKGDVEILHRVSLQSHFMMRYSNGPYMIMITPTETGKGGVQRYFEEKKMKEKHDKQFQVSYLLAYWKDLNYHKYR